MQNQQNQLQIIIKIIRLQIQIWILKLRILISPVRLEIKIFIIRLQHIKWLGRMQIIKDIGQSQVLLGMMLGPKNIKGLSRSKIIIGLAIVGFMLALLDALIHRKSLFALEDSLLNTIIHRKGLFALENAPLFYGFIGIVSVLLVVGIAFVLRKLLVRPTNYYEDEGQQYNE